MTEKQQYLLQLLKEIDEICKKHNLRYVMAGGSLIGVVRNEGFIPWDDDVDIYMPRDDWDKFVALAETELPPERAVQCVDVDRNYTNTFPRYASTDTCAIHRHQIIGKDKAGEIVDVLTLDPIPVDDKEYEKYRTHLMIYSELVNIVVVFGNRWEIPARLYFKYLMSYLFLGKDKTLKKLEKIMFSYKEEDCDRYAMRWGGCPFLFDKDEMFPVKYRKFEGLDVMVPNRISDYLIWHYGDEWSYIPPHGERESHDAVEFHDITYKEFREEYMPKINTFRMRADAVIRKMYHLATAKRTHRLRLKRQLLLAKEIEMDLKARIRENDKSLAELTEKRNFRKLTEIYQEYYRVQLSADFIGREDFVNIYSFYHPVLVELEDEVFETAMLTLMYTEKVSKAYRMLQLREKMGTMTARMRGFTEDIQLFRKAAGHYEFGEMEEAERITDMLLEKYPENPSFMKFKIRFEMIRARQDKIMETAWEYLGKCLELFPEDGYFLKYKGELLWMEGECRTALEIFVGAREKTTNGITQLELDKLLEEYKIPALKTCRELAENAMAEEATELALLWQKLLPGDRMVDEYICLASVWRAQSMSQMEELTEEITGKIETCLVERKDMEAKNIPVYCEALEKAWERLGYPSEVARLRVKLIFVDKSEELELLCEEIRNYMILKDKQAEVLKLIGDVRMKQGQTAAAFESYRKAIRESGSSYVKKELGNIILEDLYQGSRAATAYAKKVDAIGYMDAWLGRYGSKEEIQELINKIV